MRITGSMGIQGFDSYRVSSIHGNPQKTAPIQPIDSKEAQGNGALVIATKEKEELYVKDYGELPEVMSTQTGGFAQILETQELMKTDTNIQAQNSQQFTDYLNDTIGVMGFQNHLRDQLLGMSFMPF